MRNTRAQITAEAIELGERRAYADVITTLQVYRSVLGDIEALARIKAYVERKLAKMGKAKP